MHIPYRHLGGVGLIVFAISHAVLAVEATHDGRPEDLLFLGIIGGVAVAIAAVAFRFDRFWAAGLTAVAGVLAFLMGISSLEYVFTDIDSVWMFAPASIALPGSVGAALFGTADLVQRWRRASREAPDALAAAFAAVLAVVAALITASIGITNATADTVSASERGGAQVLAIDNYEYRPVTVTARVGETVRLVVENRDFATHTFSVKGTDIDEEIGGGDERLVKFVAPAAGEYQIHCTIAYHDDMKATLVVQ